MKNQYFGDNRDLFKYDLVYFLMRNIIPFCYFTFIPMLTKDDNRRHGDERDRSKARAGTQNTELLKFLDKYNHRNKRDITQIEGYFIPRGFQTKICPEVFENRNRAVYFQKIETELSDRSLILIDPDNGLQIKSSNKRHVLYCELKQLFGKMDNDSLIMVYQHFPRVNHGEYLLTRTTQIRSNLDIAPLFITDNQIIFFLVVKNQGLRESLRSALHVYKSQYPKLQTGPSESYPSKYASQSHSPIP
jgi:hypothetical protein